MFTNHYFSAHFFASLYPRHAVVAGEGGSSMPCRTLLVSVEHGMCWTSSFYLDGKFGLVFLLAGDLLITSADIPSQGDVYF